MHILNIKNQIYVILLIFKIKNTIDNNDIINVNCNI